jgi:hypothetical protein
MVDLDTEGREAVHQSKHVKQWEKMVPVSGEDPKKLQASCPWMAVTNMSQRVGKLFNSC